VTDTEFIAVTLSWNK